MASIPSHEMPSASAYRATEWILKKGPEAVAIYDAIGQETVARVPMAIVDMIIDYSDVRKTRCVFGVNDWARHFGRVPQAPPFPKDIEEIWEGPCPIFRGSKVRETHLLVYVPATVNRRPLTLKYLSELAAKYFPFPRRPEFGELGNQLADAGWLLITKAGLPDSRGCHFDAQQTMIAELSKRTSVNYECPKALDVMVCVLALFSNEHCTSGVIRCQETICAEVEGHRVVGRATVGFIGGVDKPTSFLEMDSRLEACTIGSVALRKFRSLAPAFHYK